MYAIDVMDIVLEDDGTENGGVSFVGETVEDFLKEAGVTGDFISVNALNEVLVECGIKPIVPTLDHCIKAVRRTTREYNHYIWTSKTRNYDELNKYGLAMQRAAEDLAKFVSERN